MSEYVIYSLVWSIAGFMLGYILGRIRLDLIQIKKELAELRQDQ